MTGKEAYNLMKNMTAEELEATQIVWFDSEQLGNLQGDDAEQKAEFFESLPPAKQSELLGRGLYTRSGDYNKAFDTFLEHYVENFEKAIEEAIEDKLLENEEDAER